MLGLPGGVVEASPATNLASGFRRMSSQHRILDCVGHPSTQDCHHDDAKTCPSEDAGGLKRRRCLACAGAGALAQPAHPLHRAFAPGGTTDILGRVVGEKLAIALGQPIVIENKPGQEGRSRPPAQAPAGP